MKGLKIILFVLFCFLTLTIDAQTFYRINRLPINTHAFSELAPVIFETGIIYSSNRKLEVIDITDQEGKYFYNLYYTKKKDNKNWTKPDVFSKDLVSKFHESNASISSDGKTLFYTSTMSSTGKIADMDGSDTLYGIMVSIKTNDTWQTPRKFEYNSNQYNVGYPCISEDGNRLYFAAENPEGYGGYDIYYTDRIGGRWTTPVNLGENVNTAENDVYPFISNDNRLYFTSRGHDETGGADIFYSDFFDDEWQNPVKLASPFNSNADDFAFSATTEMDTGYFSSNRRGTDDIYQFVSTFPSFAECPEQVEETYCYEFYESGLTNLDTTSLKYEWDLGDGKFVRETRVIHCYDAPGYYLVQLNVVDTLTGEISSSEAAYDLNIEKLEQPYMLSPDTARVNENVSFDASESHIKEFTIENHYWDFGDGSMLDEEDAKHSYDKPGTYIVRLGLTGANKNDPEKLDKACANKQIIIIER